MKKILADPVVKFFISVIGLFVIFIVLMELQHIFIPLVIAYFFFFVFEPLSKMMASVKVPKGVAILAEIVIIILVFWGISNLIVGSFERFGDELPMYEEKLNSIVQKNAIALGIDDPALTRFSLSRLIEDIDYGGLASGFFSSTVSFFSTILFSTLFFIFVSSGHGRIFEAFKKRFVEKKAETTVKKLKKKEKNDGEIEEVTIKKYDPNADLRAQKEVMIERTFKDITNQIQKYIITKFLISFLTGLFSGIILWLFDVDFYIVWAVLTFLLNFIPNIGSFIAVILPALMSLIQFENAGYTLIIVALLIVTQNIFANLVEPKLIGERLGLNPLVVLLSLLLWGFVWGTVGMFLAVPITAVIKIVISNAESRNMHFIRDLMSN